MDRGGGGGGAVRREVAVVSERAGEKAEGSQTRALITAARTDKGPYRAGDIAGLKSICRDKRD